MLDGANHHYDGIVIGRGSAGAVNPALMIIANAPRVADIIKRRLSV